MKKEIREKIADFQFSDLSGTEFDSFSALGEYIRDHCTFMHTEYKRYLIDYNYCQDSEGYTHIYGYRDETDEEYSTRLTQEKIDKKNKKLQLKLENERVEKKEKELLAKLKAKYEKE